MSRPALAQSSRVLAIAPGASIRPAPCWNGLWARLPKSAAASAESISLHLTWSGVRVGGSSSSIRATTPETTAADCEVPDMVK